MPVSLRFLDATAAGTQTLRLVTALVCSISVTTAVAGPMAYQAIEFRRSHDDVAAPSTIAVPDPLEVTDAQRGVLDDSGQAHDPAGVAPLAPATTSAPTTASPTIATAPSTAAPTTGADITAAAAAAGPAEQAPTTVVSATPPATSDGPAPPAPADVAPTSAPAEPAPPAAAVTSAPTSAPVTIADGAGRNPLDEFNPRRACDDKAQELNADRETDCPPTP